MKLKKFENEGMYVSPDVTEIDAIPEGVLCASGEGSTAEMYDRVGDTDGWEL